MTIGHLYVLLGYVKPLHGSYGANLRRMLQRLSEKLGHRVTQEELAQRMGRARQGNLPQRLRSANVPRPETIVRDARALDCQPADLMDGIVLPHDPLRARPPMSTTEAVDSLAEAVSRDEPYPPPGLAPPLPVLLEKPTLRRHKVHAKQTTPKRKRAK